MHPARTRCWWSIQFENISSSSTDWIIWIICWNNQCFRICSGRKEKGFFSCHIAVNRNLNWYGPFERLTLIASDPRISAAFVILSASKMILIYLNYRIWSVKLKDIYGHVLDTLAFDRNGKQNGLLAVLI